MIFRSEEAWCALSRVRCYACGHLTPVRIVLLPHSATGEEEDDEDPPPPTPGDGGIKLSMITKIEAGANELVAPTFKMGASRTAGRIYLANHCEACDALQGDYFVSHPDGPFWPGGKAPVDFIKLTGPVRIRAEGYGQITVPLGDLEEQIVGTEALSKRREQAARIARRRQGKSGG